MREAPTHHSDRLDLAGMVGTGPAMKRVFERIRKAARTDATVLITGESGTGKELAGRALHMLNGRCHGPFVPVNCGAIPDTLAESQLFGHVKGTFTGADRDHAGYFAQADGGTLFLDEIGDLPVPSQVKLLRVLDDGTYFILGGRKMRTANVRVVAATHRDLQRRVQAEQFREDLYYRLNVLTIALPPLRRRPEDIPVLAALFLEFFARRHGCRGCRLTDDARQALCAYRFPGNVRELRHMLERGVVNSDDGWITIEHLGLPRDACAGIDPAGSRLVPVRGRSLLAALETIRVQRADGRTVPWYRTLRDAATLTAIYAFLTETGAAAFTRTQFAEALRSQSETGKNKYKTAGDYLKRLHTSGIVQRNAGKANQARYWLSPTFVHPDGGRDAGEDD
jgi:DNA-binding NtrC family response regulator